ncbi:MAG: Crp/Fnr family transcriptional regulator [Cyanobacteria bacterium P01_G01_bin.67]
MLLSQKLNSNLSLGRREDALPLQQFQKGDEISVLDSGIWQVYRGVVELSRIRQDGSEVISGWITANGVFGDISANSSLYRAVSLCDVYAKRYSARDVVRHSSLARQFIAQFSDRLVKSQQLLAIIAISRVEERLKQFLLMLKQEMGQPATDGIRLQVRFTHQHLAEAIHTTRVTITRILGDFQHQGLIYFDNERHIVIKDL